MCVGGESSIKALCLHYLMQLLDIRSSYIRGVGAASVPDT